MLSFMIKTSYLQSLLFSSESKSVWMFVLETETETLRKSVFY